MDRPTLRDSLAERALGRDGAQGIPLQLLDWNLEQLSQRWRESEWTPWSGPVGRSLTLAPWKQDPLPFVLADSDWSILENGLLQRARFLEALADDLYGQGQLLRQGILPWASVHDNPAYLWPMVGSEPLDGWLCVAAFDVVRTDNVWRVVEDHIQEPRGLERVPLLRARMAQAYPEILREIHPVSSLAGLSALRDLLEGPLIDGAVPGRLVLLAPDLDEAPSPEFAALAREMGVELVDGEDLVVREGQLWLRTVEGLLPVRGLLRFLPDGWSDPLELRPDTGPGVPALCQSIRLGNIHVANPPGAGVLETAAFWPWHDRICRLLLGESLLLQGPKSHWCCGGQEDPQMLGDLEHQILKRAFPGMGGPMTGAALGPEARAILIEKIKAQPGTWVAQERLGGLDVALCEDGQVSVHPATLRLFAVKGPDGWRILPGGFARVVKHQITGDSSFICKDLWVTRAPRGDQPSWRPRGIRRTSGEVPSRVAENLWWLGRYAERAEVRARTLRALLIRLSEGKNDLRSSQEIRALAELCGDVGSLDPEALTIHCLQIEIATVAADLRAAARNAWAVRERLSDDTARIVERLDRDALRCQQSDDPAEVVRRLTGILLDLAALAGLGAENTVRGHGWSFLGLGRRVERAMGISGQLKRILSNSGEFDTASLSAFLEVWDSTLTYRGRYMALPTLAQTCDLLLLDPTNPRALIFQLQEAIAHLSHLPRAASEKTVVIAIVEALNALPVGKMDEEGSAWIRTHLAERMGWLHEELKRLTFALEIRQFAHVEPAWQGGRL
ncbi:MAG: hypothetical protein RL318_2445 [Fibrobacterota bacterium]|jgi:uncharacterized circularly permuted ATP-grasp superfamily protein/uncharacterized alpha-E superfamily protein